MTQEEFYDKIIEKIDLIITSFFNKQGEAATAAEENLLLQREKIFLDKKEMDLKLQELTLREQQLEKERLELQKLSTQ